MATTSQLAANGGLRLPGHAECGGKCCTDPSWLPVLGETKEPLVSLAWSDAQSSIYCGDAFVFLTTLATATVDCVWTDPPYFISNGGTTCFNGERVSVDKGSWDKSRGWRQDYEFHRKWIAECYRILKPTGTIWISGTYHVYPAVGLALQEFGFRILNDIIWEVPNPTPNLGCRTFTYATETIYWATKARPGKERYTFNYDEMKAENGGKQMKNVWTFTSPGKSEKTHGKHPTQKPLALLERCLRASNNPGDLIVDPFCGSGTTGVAAANLGLNFLLNDADEDYVRLAIRRLQEN